jgi:hypothetical protein
MMRPPISKGIGRNYPVVQQSFSSPSKEDPTPTLSLYMSLELFEGNLSLVTRR